MNIARFSKWFSIVVLTTAGVVCDPSARASPTGRQAAGIAPSFSRVQGDFVASDAMLLDRHGRPLHLLRLDLERRRLPWVALDDISPAMRGALIASEDRRFYQHGGVDWNAVAAAAWANLWNSRTRGASTITMQLAGLLDDDLRRGGAPRSGVQKVGQAWMARSLERRWRKDQILEAYLNLVSFRGELVGVHALSRVLFDKHPSGLDHVEAALAVALIRAPNAAPALVARRACAILADQGAAASCAGIEGLAQLRLTRLGAATGPGTASAPKPAPLSPHPASQLAPQLAPHLARRLLRRPGPPQRSTIDADIQRLAGDLLRRHLKDLAGRQVEDGAVLVLDNASGEVLAWVGSSGALSSAAQVDHVTAPRQAGSTLKPFLYQLALEGRWMTAASILDDSPLDLATASGLYIPQNYDRRYRGRVSLRTALGSSLNIPAVRTLVDVTPQRLFGRLQALGLNLRESGDHYGYSLALGSADVSLHDLVNAYRALANGGRYGPVVTTSSPPGASAQSPPARPATRAALAVQSARAVQPSQTSAAQTVQTVQAAPPPTAQNSATVRAARTAQVMDAGASFIVSDILADRNARAATFGLDSALSTRFWSAVKTGTSKDMRDNWCIGYSTRYTVGVWVGNASGAPMWNVSGVSGAAPVWQALMQALHEREQFDGQTTDADSRAAGRAGKPDGPDAPGASSAGNASGASGVLKTPAILKASAMRFAQPATPSGVVKTTIVYGDNLEASREEFFLEGTQQTTITAAQPYATAPPIASPVDGSIIALDPDIPPQRQRLRFSAGSHTRKTASWLLDGKPLRTVAADDGAFLSPTTLDYDWMPWPGRHRLALVDLSGKTLAAVHFEVRGARLRHAVSPR